MFYRTLPLMILSRMKSSLIILLLNQLKVHLGFSQFTIDFGEQWHANIIVKHNTFELHLDQFRQCKKKIFLRWLKIYIFEICIIQISILY